MNVYARFSLSSAGWLVDLPVFKEFAQRYLLAFYRAIFPSFGENCPGRRRKDIDK